MKMEKVMHLIEDCIIDYENGFETDRYTLATIRKICELALDELSKPEDTDYN